VNFYHFFLLELLHYVFPAEYRMLYELRHEFLEGNFKIESLSNKPSPKFKALYDELCVKSNVQETNSIKNKLYFFRYFSLNLLASDFTKTAFDESFDLPEMDLQKKLIEFNAQNSPLLAEKLQERLASKGITNKEEFIKVVAALLALFGSINRYKSQQPLKDSVNNYNLAPLIFQMVYRSDLILISDKFDFLRNLVMQSEYKHNFSFRNLFSPDNARFFSDEADSEKIRSTWEGFRSIQLQFLKEAILAESVIRLEIVRQIQFLHSFVTRDSEGNYNPEQAAWFINQIIIPNIEFLNANINSIFDHIHSVTFEKGSHDLLLVNEVMDSIFHSKETLLLLEKPIRNGNNQKLEMIYIGYVRFKEIVHDFVNQQPKLSERTDLNDDILSDPFEMGGKTIDFRITPGDTQYWRFGFRMSVDNSFDEIATTRHTDQYPYIHLSRGKEENKVWSDEEPLPRLDLAVYTGGTLSRVTPVILDYKNQPVEFTCQFIHDGKIQFKMQISPEPAGLFSQVIDEFMDKGFRYMQVSAWCDHRPFHIHAIIREYSIPPL
jgi:hypothetical protein